MKNILINPRLTEKAYTLATEGIYTFDVPVNINKNEVKAAVKNQYNVDAVNVSIVKQTGKAKSFVPAKNRYPKIRLMSDTKKAYVRLAQGQSIAIFETASADTNEVKESK